MTWTSNPSHCLILICLLIRDLHKLLVSLANPCHQKASQTNIHLVSNTSVKHIHVSWSEVSHTWVPISDLRFTVLIKRSIWKYSSINQELDTCANRWLIYIIGPAPKSTEFGLTDAPTRNFLCSLLLIFNVLISHCCVWIVTEVWECTTQGVFSWMVMDDLPVWKLRLSASVTSEHPLLSEVTTCFICSRPEYGYRKRLRQMEWAAKSNTCTSGWTLEFGLKNRVSTVPSAKHCNVSNVLLLRGVLNFR